MNIFLNLDDLPSFSRTVITIGAFDGVHAGHRKILKRVQQLAKEYTAESVVITFNPHPREVIYPKDTSLKLLTSLEEKFPHFEEIGIDHVVVVPFTIEFSQMIPREYVENFLIQKFSPACIVLGYDHRFGLNRAGNVDLLRQYEHENAFKVIEIPRQESEEIIISSTKIRNAIAKADIQLANQLLGHPFALLGTIEHGEKIGSQIGFPTANLRIDHQKKLIPPDGIYAVELEFKDAHYKGMLYIGNRPTLNNHRDKKIEVNIFDFNEQIYGEKIKISFQQFIRHDKKFDSLETLANQLGKDRIDVQQYFEESLNKVKQKPELAVVILNYNGISHLKRFLPSYVQLNYGNYQIYVADNASTDQSIQYLEEHYPRIRILELDKNYGFAGGYNQALEQIEADYFAIVNSDLNLTPDWATQIIDYMETEPSVAVCQPKILNVNDELKFEYAGASGGYIDLLGYPFCRGRILDNIEEDSGQYEDIQSIFWASGAACIIRADAFRMVGGFDDDFFAHQEEIDLCWRLQRAGYGIKVVPTAKVFHLGGGTLSYDNPKKVFLNFRNNLATLIKNQNRLPLLIVLLIRLFLDGLAGLNYLVKGQFQNCLAIIKAHLNLYAWFPSLLRKRRAFKIRLQKHQLLPKRKLKGVYRGYMLIDYYMLGRKHFSDLPIKKGINEL